MVVESEGVGFLRNLRINDRKSSKSLRNIMPMPWVVWAERT